MLDCQPLGNLRSGETGIVVSISGGNAFMSRMFALGFSPGIEVTVLQNQFKGPILISVRDLRLALGRGEAKNITVQQCRR